MTRERESTWTVTTGVSMTHQTAASRVPGRGFCAFLADDSGQEILEWCVVWGVLFVAMLAVQPYVHRAFAYVLPKHPVGRWLDAAFGLWPFAFLYTALRLAIVILLAPRSHGDRGILLIAALNMTRPRRMTLIDQKYSSASNTAVGWGLSLVAGNISGMLGVGGGIVQIPMMRTVMKVPFKIATATSSYMIGITVAPAAAIYMLRGDIDPYKSAAIILGTFAGSRAGAAISYRITSLLLRLLFVIIMIFTAYKMLARGFQF